MCGIYLKYVAIIWVQLKYGLQLFYEGWSNQAKAFFFIFIHPCLQFCSCFQPKSLIISSLKNVGTSTNFTEERVNYQLYCRSQCPQLFNASVYFFTSDTLTLNTRSIMLLQNFIKYFLLLQWVNVFAIIFTVHGSAQI